MKYRYQKYFQSLLPNKPEKDKIVRIGDFFPHPPYLPVIDFHLFQSKEYFKMGRIFRNRRTGKLQISLNIESKIWFPVGVLS